MLYRHFIATENTEEFTERHRGEFNR